MSGQAPGRAGPPWGELLTFQYFQRVCPSAAGYGYSGDSMQGMREREFRRLGVILGFGLIILRSSEEVGFAHEAHNTIRVLYGKAISMRSLRINLCTYTAESGTGILTLDMTYLDHAGTALFPQSLLKEFTDDLSKNIYGNPHSQNISSKLTYDTIEHVRYRILQHFSTTAEDYTVIFTSGSTAALKLVAETFPWIPEDLKHPSSLFCYLTDSHTSVVGMRGITAAMNVLSVPVKPKDILLSEENRVPAEEQNCMTPHLFCYPAQSNFSGTKYPLSWIQEIKSGKLCPVKTPGKWFVLLDAASYVSTSPLDLTVYQPDFVPISFYKIFGFPTGLGALLVNNHIAPLLRKSYFGGGTAAGYLAGEDFYFPRPSIAERFEDGTISFLDIIALKHGFDTLERLTGGMENIKHHTFALSRYTYTVLSTLKYANGAPIVHIYSDSDFSSPDVQGPIINFNVLDENGDIIGYSQVDKLASLYNIHVRTGCFCNTGACQQHLGISNEDVKRNLQAGHVCGDDIDIIDGRPTGSVRISFGYMSTFEDAQTFLKFIIATRLSESDIKFPSQSTSQETTSQSVGPSIQNDHTANNCANKFSLNTIISDMEHWNNSFTTLKTSEIRTAVSSESTIPVYRSGSKPITVTNIYLYPIKSCSAFEVSEWPVGNQGLLYDRNWMVVNQNGVCISQKQEPRLCLVHPLIDLEQKIMVIKAEGVDPISVPLEENTGREIKIGQSKVCAHRVQTYDCGERIAEWFSELLGRQCRLIRQSSDFKRNANQKHGKGQAASVPLSLVNEAQYLLINTASILQLKEQITERLGEPLQTEELIQRFRANLVISATESFEEEEWAEISIGTLHFQVVGPCNRCQIICIDPQTGQRNKEFLQTLSSTRGRKMNFGIYLMNQSLCSSLPNILSVGSQVFPVLKEDTEIQSPASNEEKTSG